MRKTTLSVLLLMSAMALVAVAPALAQDNVKASIPFAFNLGSKALPAGDYEVRRLAWNLVTIQEPGTKNQAVAITMVAPPANLQQQSVLVFNKYGERYFLSEIRTPETTKVLTKSKLEREVAESAAETADITAPYQVVYVAARLQ